MGISLKNRNFLTLLDFSSEEIKEFFGRKFDVVKLYESKKARKGNSLMFKEVILKKK